ncbi:hypothetical protein D3C73_1341450 [compost metagenome]
MADLHPALLVSHLEAVFRQYAARGIELAPFPKEVSDGRGDDVRPITGRPRGDDERRITPETVSEDSDAISRQLRKGGQRRVDGEVHAAHIEVGLIGPFPINRHGGREDGVALSRQDLGARAVGED